MATKVGEEGLDIQTCCLVIRFDLPETVASFIQSRGRARMPQSEYAFLVDRFFSKACGVYYVHTSAVVFSNFFLTLHDGLNALQGKSEGARFVRKVQRR